MNGDIRHKMIASKAAPWSRNIEIRYGIFEEGIEAKIARIIEFESIKPGEYAGPMMTVDLDCAQMLMDSLWDCGLRPSEGTGSAGALAATERHLKDLQRLVFKEKK